MTKPKPITFSPAMVNAIRERRKTMTRRLSSAPRYAVGDILYVKEHAWYWCRMIVDGKTKTGRPKHRYIPLGPVVYKADEPSAPTERIDHEPDRLWRFKPARFMPASFARFRLEVTATKRELLQDISEADARAEGAKFELATIDSVRLGAKASYQSGFRNLWINLHGPDAWEENQEVAVTSFKPIDEPTKDPAHG
jgi:hypothetical protein